MRCNTCRGTGRDPLSDNVNWLPCTQCGGTGEERRPALPWQNPYQTREERRRILDELIAKEPDPALREFLIGLDEPDGTYYIASDGFIGLSIWPIDLLTQRRAATD